MQYVQFCVRKQRRKYRSDWERQGQRKRARVVVDRERERQPMRDSIRGPNDRFFPVNWIEVFFLSCFVYADAFAWKRIFFICASCVPWMLLPILLLAWHGMAKTKPRTTIKQFGKLKFYGWSFCGKETLVALFYSLVVCWCCWCCCCCRMCNIS